MPSARGRRSTSSAWAYSRPCSPPRGALGEYGGFVSPSGVPCLASSTASGAKPLVIAIKRVVLDARVARAAAEAGAELVEDTPVARADFSPADGLWTIQCQTRRGSALRGAGARDRGRSPVSPGAGAGPRDDAPDRRCSRSYVAPGTYGFAADGVLFYPASLLPGYCSVFREADGSFSFCCYVIPGGPPCDGPQGAPPRASRGRSAPPIGPGAGRPGWSRCAPRQSGSAACHGARATTSSWSATRRGRSILDRRGHPVRHGRRGDRGRRRSRRRSRRATSASGSSSDTIAGGWPRSAGTSDGRGPWPTPTSGTPSCWTRLPR